jgi:hypothetical protein
MRMPSLCQDQARLYVRSVSSNKHQGRSSKQLVYYIKYLWSSCGSHSFHFFDCQGKLKLKGNPVLLTSQISNHRLLISNFNRLRRLITGLILIPVDKTHIRCESRVRHPLSRGTWRSLFQHAINLLKRETLSLRDKEVRECERDAAEASPHEEHLGSEVGVMFGRSDEIRGDNTDNLR